MRTSFESSASIGASGDYRLEFETKLADFIIDLLIFTVDKVQRLQINDDKVNVDVLRVTLDFCALDKSVRKCLSDV